MKEYKFKVLGENDFLSHFTENEMIIGSSDGSYKIYKIFGYEDGSPEFYKNFETVTIFDFKRLSENIVYFLNKGEYFVYKILTLENGYPVFDKTFRIIISKGKPKIEMYDTDTKLTLRWVPQELHNGG